MNDGMTIWMMGLVSGAAFALLAMWPCWLPAVTQ